MIRKMILILILICIIALFMSNQAVCNNVDIHNISFKEIIEGLQNRIIALESTESGKNHLVYPQKWATGDGTVENPWANNCIQKAYDFIPAGGTIFLRAGYYQLAGQLTINKKINIFGEGIDKTTVMTVNANGFYLDIDSSHSSLKDFTVDGDAQNDGTGSCFVIKYANYLFLENIKVKNAGYYGMSVIGSYSTFKNIYAVDNYRHGIHPGGSAANSNLHNTYKDIYCWNNGNCGFADKGTYGSSCNVYDNFHCWNNEGHGIDASFQNGGSLTNSVVHDNGKRGIRIVGSNNFVVENCFVHSNGSTGIYIYAGDNIILSNVISKNNNVVEAAHSGLHILDVPSTKLSSCQFYDDRDPPLQHYGIYAQGITEYINIISCKLTPNKLGAIRNDAGAIVNQWPSDNADLTKLMADFNNLKIEHDALKVRIKAASEAINE